MKMSFVLGFVHLCYQGTIAYLVCMADSKITYSKGQGQIF